MHHSTSPPVISRATTAHHGNGRALASPLRQGGVPPALKRRYLPSLTKFVEELELAFGVSPLVFERMNRVDRSTY